MAARAKRPERIAVEVPERASLRQQRELGAFARYCIMRVERELGERESWVVKIAASRTGYASRVAVRQYGVVVEEQGTGQDGALATWDAMCRLEQALRERRGS
jgi:hypothetical protein